MNSDPYIQSMFGCNAIQVPFNCIVQSNPKDKTVMAVIVVGHTPGVSRYTFGSNATHQLILGDAVIRPRLVMESEHLVGMGISGIAREGMSNINDWIKNGKVILDAFGDLKPR